MRKLYFLVPGTGGKFACGGLWAELKTLHLAQQLCPAEVVTYRQRESKTLYLDDLLCHPPQNEVIFVISWGFDVARLATRLKSHHVVYHAHSSGYRLRLPARIPIITVSRNTMGYWGQHSPHAPIYYLPNQIGDEFRNFNQTRDIDVLVQARKSSVYLMQDLIPALQQQCRVLVVNDYVEDLAALFNRAKVYLYDSAEYWAQQGVSEGFGLQPMEAIACGCQVFSSVNGGLSDYLDPGFNCQKIACYSKTYDISRILSALAHPTISPMEDQCLAEHRTEKILQRFQVILEEVNGFFDHQPTHAPDIRSLKRIEKIQSFLQKVSRKLTALTH